MCQEGKTLILISHDREALARMDRIVEIRDGEIVAESCEAGRAKK